MRDAVLVGIRDCLHHPAEQRHALSRRSPTLTASPREIVLQGFALDPFEDMPRDACGVCIVHEHARVVHGDDARVAQPRQCSGLEQELGECVAPAVGVTPSGVSEHLDRDRSVESEVLPRVHDAEATLGDDAVDPVLALEQPAGEMERVRRPGGVLRTRPRAATLGHRHQVALLRLVAVAHGSSTADQRSGTAALRCRWFASAAAHADCIQSRTTSCLGAKHLCALDHQ
jgi:hypothetical protein